MPHIVADALAPTGIIVLVVLVTAGGIELGYRLLLRLGREVPLLRELVLRAHRPLQAEAATLSTIAAIRTTTEEGTWRPIVLHLLLLAAIAAGGWLVTNLLLVLIDAALRHVRTDIEDDLEARRIRTRVLIVRRLAVAVIAVLTVGICLVTFESVRAVGASVLASAGLLSVVAGLAAQSTLGNLFAGLQLVFSNALRIDDVVVVEGEWGRIEELTLGYVVVRIWDERRLIMPTSYFTTQPFRHWTRNQTELLGTVYLDVDWSVPIPEMRKELEHFCASHPAWDGRAQSLLVTDATNGLVRVRAMISAADSSKLWELQCAVREHLVEWIRTEHPEALPRIRTDVRGLEVSGAA